MSLIERLTPLAESPNPIERLNRPLCSGKTADEFQDAFSGMVVPFAEMAADGCNAFVECGRTRKVNIFSPGRMMIAESRTEQIV
jgi:hypothetical protein